MLNKILFFFVFTLSCIAVMAQPRSVVKFDKDWKFYLGDDSTASTPAYNDVTWRTLNLPHDWSIEGNFSENYPTTFNQAALPAGTGWYRKTFTLPETSANQRIFINFDGVYRNSEVWINGHHLGKRPNGYISFQYELTPYLNFGADENVIAVRVDNSAQPNSRWYTGSGIYRNVWLETRSGISIPQWGSFITTPQVSEGSATVQFQTRIEASGSQNRPVELVYEIVNAAGQVVCKSERMPADAANGGTEQKFTLTVKDPHLWSTDAPYLYTAVTKVYSNGEIVDQVSSALGIRNFEFDAEKGFSLNGHPMKILGVCMHHDLGALGAAVNTRAIERQLEILKEMGCNAIRTAHNPPAPELLDLCDKMGFIVMDEAFDMWRKKKNKFDYSVDFPEWHRQDLADLIKRDRNHPSVFIWSIGNEIREQFDSSGIAITKELVNFVKQFDSTRPVTCALTENNPEKNFIYQSHALDLLGFNYKLNDYPELPKKFPGENLLASETASSFATRGHYDMPSDSNRVWPPDAKPFNDGNADYTVSAYDHVYAYWGATHEASWNAVKNNPFMAGTFVWSGFDFLGEPIPYRWPARSSYYGIVDLAGFPKDVYYMYQSEWTGKPVLHIFPHWNWTAGDSVDVWAYYSNADEVELFLNGKSLGSRKKNGDELHVMWRVKYQPGTLKAVSKKNGHRVMTRKIKTAGRPAKIELCADRKTLQANGEDLSFITVNILDKKGNPVPFADNLINFSIAGAGHIAGVDNGYQASHESFKALQRKAYNGKCLVIVRSTEKQGRIRLTANAAGLPSQTIKLVSR